MECLKILRRGQCSLEQKFEWYFSLMWFFLAIVICCGPGSSVGIATELRAGRSGIESLWGWDFPPVQTCPGAHPASCTMGIGSFPGVKCGRVVLLTTHPLLVPRSWNSRAIPGQSGIESRWGRDFPPVQTGPGAHPASCKMGTGSFPGVKCGRGVLLATQPFLVPRSWKSRAIPLPTLWATPGPVAGSLNLYLYCYTLLKDWSLHTHREHCFSVTGCRIDRYNMGTAWPSI